MRFKLTGLLLLLPFFGLAQKISLSANNLPIKTVFELLQSRSNYYILYSDEVVPDSMRVSLQADQWGIEAVMQQLLAGKPLDYRVTAKGMVIISAQRKPLSSAIAAGLSGQALPFASVTLRQNRKVLTGCIADENGLFRLDYAFAAGSLYTLQCSTVGYETFSRDFIYPDTAFARQITLTAASQTLSTVNIVAQRPLVSRKADRYVINVEGSFLENGFSALEVLQRSPGIWVNNDGSIRIKGNQSVMVMINDVVQRMSADDLAEYLRALKSEAISKIEVISNPPSEYEASGTGGIVHIQLKKSRSDGQATSLYTQYRQQQKRPYISAGGLTDVKAGSLYFFGNAFLSSDESAYIGTYHIQYPDNSLFDSFTNRYNHNQRLQYRLGTAYDFSKDQSISLQTIGSTSKLEQSFITDIRFNAVTGLSNSRWLRRPTQNSSTFNYLWKTDSLGSSLKVIGDYAYAFKTELNEFNSAYSEPTRNSIFRVNTPTTTRILSFQTDYTRALAGKAEWKGGLKYAGTDRDNELITEDIINNNWVRDPLASNHFLYHEQLLMGYTSIAKTWGKTSVKAGLRGEDTRLSGNSLTSGQQISKHYFGLFPSFFISNETWHFSYSRRLQRPAYKELNPYRLQFDNFLVNIGNPDLLPQYTHNFELGLDLKGGYSAMLYLASTNNTISQFAQPIAGNVLEYQFRNFSGSTEYGANIDLPLQLTKWWTLSNSFSVYHLSYLLLNGQGNSQVSFFAKTAQTLKFPKLFDVSFYYEYRSPYASGNSRFGQVLFNELGFSRKFLKGDKGRVQLYFEDIFNTFEERERTNYNQTRIDFYQKRPTRTVSLQFNYTISSGKKFTNKKVDQSNNDEKSRL
jgi:hypothetical protein